MRVFFKEGSSIIDITKDINRYRSDTYLMSLATNDAIYIASDYPLNHFYVKVGDAANNVSSSVLIDYWSSQGWVPAVNINDYTEAFSKSGFIEFTPDIDNGWLRENTNSSGQRVDGLTSISVYDSYWIKLTVDTTLTNNVELEYIGNKFSDDDDLFSEYPLFNDVTFITAFEASKDSWEEQHIRAADLIIQDLKRKRVILSGAQILDREILNPASVSKVAELIYTAFGRDYVDQKKDAKDEYNRRLDMSQFNVDTDSNAILEPHEMAARQGWLTR
jgi:hypothetical protein